MLVTCKEIKCATLSSSIHSLLAPCVTVDIVCPEPGKVPEKEAKEEEEKEPKKETKDKKKKRKPKKKRSLLADLGLSPRPKDATVTVNIEEVSSNK